MATGGSVPKTSAVEAMRGAVRGIGKEVSRGSTYFAFWLGRTPNHHTTQVVAR